MTDNEILEKAIRKAERNGYKTEFAVHPMRREVIGDLLDDFQELNIIFNHDFAKAFFGEEYYVCHRSESIPVTMRDLYGGLTHRPENLDKLLTEWQYHLQQMVLEEEPIKYLEKFLE